MDGGSIIGTVRKKKPCPAKMAFEAFSKALDNLDAAKVEKIQCWDHMKCSDKARSSCVAISQSAGRRCWLVAGTLSGGEPICEKAKKYSSCKECDFYIKVKQGVI